MFYQIPDILFIAEGVGMREEITLCPVADNFGKLSFDIFMILL